MESDLWKSVEVCLREMLCANTDRSEYLQSDRLDQVQREAEQAAQEHEKFMEQLSEADRVKLEKYIDLLDQCSFEKEQRAYAQGLIDSFELLMKLGLIQKTEFVEQIIQSML